VTLLLKSIIRLGIKTKISVIPKKLLLFFFKISRCRIKVAENKYLPNSQGIKGYAPNILAKTSNEDK
jgi:hypothetical protein